MNNKVITALFLIVGIINFLPLIGIVSVDQLSKLYSISISDDNLAILMRHRALLFGIVGGFILFAAFKPQYQTAAFIMGFISMLGFIFIATQTSEYSQAIKKIIVMDWIALGCLTLALILYILDKKT